MIKSPTCVSQLPSDKARESFQLLPHILLADKQIYVDIVHERIQRRSALRQLACRRRGDCGLDAQVIDRQLWLLSEFSETPRDGRFLVRLYRVIDVLLDGTELCDRTQPFCCGLLEHGIGKLVSLEPLELVYFAIIAK